MWRRFNQTSARVCLIWQKKCHRLPRASDQLATAFWQSTPMRFRMISLQMLLSRSRVLWRYPKYRFRDALKAKATVAAWKEKPSYAVIPMQDRMINPDLERFMTKRAQSQVIELPGSHAIFLSHAPEVAALIEKAATAAK